MKTTIDIQKAKLIRKYHTLCTKIGMTEEERREMLSNNYGVESSKDLYVEELQHLCRVLQGEADKKEVKVQEARSRVFGAVGGWLDMMYGPIDRNNTAAKEQRYEKIKAIACRQTEHKDFNQIPIERLNNVSHLFSKKLKDFTRGSEIANEEITVLTLLN